MTRTLRQGHRGPDVLRWQQFLKARGFSPGVLDGTFGPKTAEATRLFQAAQGLVADGVVGALTYGKAAGHGMRSLRRLTNAELTAALIAQARRLLAAHHAAPYGSEYPFEIDGVRYVGRIEEHYHPPGGPRKPWGHHPGVSLFVDVIPEQRIEVPDEVTEGLGATPPVEEAAPIATGGVLVIDPGHGGTVTEGGSSPNNSKSPSGVLEKDLALEMALRVRQALAHRSPSVRVELTRTTDVNVSLFERARRAASVRADAFVSLHFNGFDGKARGVEALVRPKAAGNVNHAADFRFADRLVKAVHGAIRPLDDGTKIRGVKESSLAVLRDDWLGNTAASQRCPACLLEIEFLDVPAVDELFNTGPLAEEAKARVADAIATALLEEIALPVA
jgi:N-acetylmuramoyl-L-alanine amidase